MGLNSAGSFDVVSYTDAFDSMSTITTSVGKGGMNSKTEDNRLIQQLLNNRIGSILGSLVVDGIVGSKTIAAIEYFQ